MHAQSPGMIYSTPIPLPQSHTMPIQRHEYMIFIKSIDDASDYCNRHRKYLSAEHINKLGYIYYRVMFMTELLHACFIIDEHLLI